MRRARKGGPGRQPHQFLPLPSLHVPGHHVSLPVQPNAGIPGRAHVPHTHPHRQGDAEPGQLQQVSLRLQPVIRLTPVRGGRPATEQYPGNRAFQFAYDCIVSHSLFQRL